MNVPFKGGNAGPTLPDFLGTKNEVCMFNRFFIRGTYKSSPAACDLIDAHTHTNAFAAFPILDIQANFRGELCLWHRYVLILGGSSSYL